jgi:hypothetical protein
VPSVKASTVVASLVAVAVTGCPPSQWVENPARVTPAAGGECWYSPPHICSSERACDPPQPLSADCPQPRHGPATAGVDDWRPSSRRGWVRVRERLVVTEKICGYYSDFYCPAPSHPARSECDSPEFRQLACAITPSGARVHSFVVERLSKQCVRYPALDCARGECTLPRAQLVRCP